MCGILGTCLSLIAAFPHDRAIQCMSFAFVAAQSLLSYFVSGAAKLFSRQWRAGTAVRGILGTETYGNALLSRFLKPERVYLNKLACWAIIGCELTFPTAIFVPKEWSYGILALGGLFHLFNAIVLGLNRFLFAYLATYPSIILIAHVIRGDAHFFD
jgi:hypothetical protein